MRAFSRNRRKLIKPYYVRGLKKTMTGISKVTLENAIDAHIPYLEITGKTAQNGIPTPEAPVSIENANDNGMSVALHGKNLATAEQVCEKFYKYKKQEFDGRECVSFTQETTEYFTLEGGFKPNTQYTLSFDANSTGSGTDHTMFILYEDIELNYARDTVGLSGAGKWRSIVKTTLAGHTVKGIGQKHLNSLRTIYVDINSLMLQEGAVTDPVYEPYFRETIEIPTSIDVNGTSVPLLFSEYDKLAVDKEVGKVKYIEGGYYKTLTGNEPMGYSSSRGYAWVIVPHRLTGNGYSSHYQGTSVMFLNGLSFGDSGIAFSEPVFSSTDALGTYLKEQNANGTPITVLAELEKPMEYDITKTELGQALLALSTHQGENHIDLSSGASFTISYYSEVEEDTVDLTIKYVTSSGMAVQPETIKSVRKGSKYQIIVPHIDGYTRVSTEACGVADEDATVELIYKEN